MPRTRNLSANASGTIRLSSNSSDLTTTGTGAITLKTSLNVELVSGSSITVADGNLLIEANKDGTAAGNFYGFESFDGSLLSTGAGNITLEAQGGDDAATGTHVGIRLIGTTQIKSTGTGSITLTGTSGTGTFNNNGFTLGTDVQIESSSGAIQLTGSVGPSTSSDNSGITIGGKVIAHSSATITIMGTGGSGTSSNTGVGIGGLVTTSEITTENGDLVIIGVGGPASTATNNVGIGVGGAMISSTGLGKITLDGTGGTGTSNSDGVVIGGANTQINSATGNILIKGRAQPTNTSGRNYGVILGDGAKVTSTGTANITLEGIGGGGTDNNSGVFVRATNGNTALNSVNGNITITGATVPSGGGVANSSFATDLQVSNTPAGSIRITGTGSLEVIGDTQNVQSGVKVIDVGTSTVTLRPQTTGTLINLGGADANGSPSTLGLTDAELDSITAISLQIGNSNSGPINISADISRASATVVNLTSGGAINFTTGALHYGRRQLDAHAGSCRQRRRGENGQRCDGGSRRHAGFRSRQRFGDRDQRSGGRYAVPPAQRRRHGQSGRRRSRLIRHLHSDRHRQFRHREQ